jgi:hypothetical protein
MQMINYVEIINPKLEVLYEDLPLVVGQFAVFLGIYGCG